MKKLLVLMGLFNLCALLSQAQPYPVTPVYYGQLYFSNLLNQFWGTFHGSGSGLTNVGGSFTVLSDFNPPADGLHDDTPAFRLAVTDSIAHAHRPIFLNTNRLCLNYSFTSANNGQLIFGIGSGVNGSFVTQISPYTNTLPVFQFGDDTTQVSSITIRDCSIYGYELHNSINCPACIMMNGGTYWTSIQNCQLYRGTNCFLARGGTNFPVSYSGLSGCRVSQDTPIGTNNAGVRVEWGAGFYRDTSTIAKITDVYIDNTWISGPIGYWGVIVSNAPLRMSHSYVDGAGPCIGVLNGGQVVKSADSTLDPDFGGPLIAIDNITNTTIQFYIIGIQNGNGILYNYNNITLLNGNGGTNFTRNWFQGAQSGIVLSTGTNNAGAGNLSGQLLNDGYANAWLGDSALAEEIHGHGNSAFGSGALQNGQNMVENTATGHSAGNGVKFGSFNVYDGSFDGTQNKFGYHNTIEGYASLVTDTNATYVVMDGDENDTQSMLNFDVNVFGNVNILTKGPNTNLTLLGSWNGVYEGNGFANNMGVLGGSNKTSWIVPSGSLGIGRTNSNATLPLEVWSPTTTLNLFNVNGTGAISLLGQQPTVSIGAVGIIASNYVTVTTNTVNTTTLVTTQNDNVNHFYRLTYNNFVITNGAAGTAVGHFTWTGPKLGAVTHSTTLNLSTGGGVASMTFLVPVSFNTVISFDTVVSGNTGGTGAYEATVLVERL